MGLIAHRWAQIWVGCPTSCPCAAVGIGGGAPYGEAPGGHRVDGGIRSGQMITRSRHGVVCVPYAHSCPDGGYLPVNIRAYLSPKIGAAVLGGSLRKAVLRHPVMGRIIAQ